MMTEYGFSCSEIPILKIETRWDIDREESYKRLNEKHKYWICAPIMDDE